MKKIITIILSIIAINCSAQYTVTTLAGSGISGYNDGPALTAKFSGIYGIALDANGNIFVSEQLNRCIRKISTTGMVTTFAGLPGSSGTDDGLGTAAKFTYPLRLIVGVGDTIFVADQQNSNYSVFRKISPTGFVTTPYINGYDPGDFGTGFDRNSAGYTYFFMTGVNRLSPTSIVTTVGGSCCGYADGQGTSAQFAMNPGALVLDANGNLFFADTQNNRIRKVTPTGSVTTVAGSTMGFADGQGAAAQFNKPRGVAVDAYGNLYIADTGNHQIRKISSTGLVTTIAGSGLQGYNDGEGNIAEFSNPWDIKINSAGEIYIADIGNDVIRKIVGNTTTLGLLEQKMKNAILIYPNPASDFVNIELESSSINSVLNVYNTIGQKVLCEVINHFKFKLNTQPLNNGVYFIEVVDSTGRITRTKFIKE